ncbi:mechanosensitive ion channel protein 6-like [Wolffia australiana]
MGTLRRPFKPQGSMKLSPPQEEQPILFNRSDAPPPPMIAVNIDSAEAKPPKYPSKELRVSFQDPSSSSSSSEVLKCTSNFSFAHSRSVLRTKTRSRLVDPPPAPAPAPAEPDRRSGKVPRSGPQRTDDEDDDPFADEDIPDGYRSMRSDPVTVAQFASLVLISTALACSLTVPQLRRHTFLNLHLWRWELLVLVLICGRLASGCVIRVVVFFVERNFLLRKRVLYFVYGVRRAVQNCLWLGLVLIAWYCIFDRKMQRQAGERKPLDYVTKVLICLLVGTAMRLAKTLLVKVLASSFHVSTYFDRIQESLFNQYVIETLSGPPVIEMQSAKEEEEKIMADLRRFREAGAALPPELRAAAMPAKSLRSTRFPHAVSRKDASKQMEEAITVDHLHRLNQKNVSAWNMKRLMNMVRYGNLCTLDERITDSGGEDESSTQICSEYEAKAAAKKIFTNVAKPGSKYIYLVDLMRFMGEEEAYKTLSLFEGAQESKRVSRRCLKDWVVNAFRERRALSLTLNDTKTAVNKLHQMVNVVVGIIVIVIWMLILGIATVHFLVLISSQLLLVVFVFGNTCKTTFEAIIFLFIMHPFDVGDRCEVDGVQMIVEEMNILTTVFLRYDNQKIAYPNSVLSTKPISNYYRSPDMGDSIDFCVHVSTPVEKVAAMKERIKAFVEGKKEHWYPNPTVVLRDVEDMNRLKVSVWLQHRMNHQNMGERWTRREVVVQEMIKVFRELDIEYRMLPLDVSVRNIPSSGRLNPIWAA